MPKNGSKIQSPSDDFIREAVEFAMAKRGPVVAPEGLSLFDRRRYEAAIEAYRSPLRPKAKDNRTPTGTLLGNIFKKICGKACGL